jgi:hypothetical protein
MAVETLSLANVLYDIKNSKNIMDLNNSIDMLTLLVNESISNMNKMVSIGDEFFTSYFFNNLSMIADLVILKTSKRLRDSNSWKSINYVEFVKQLDYEIRKEAKEYNYPSVFSTKPIEVLIEQTILF